MTNNDKRPLGFVNRRGHSQSDISSAELSELSIDEQPTTNTPEESVVPKQEKPKDAKKPVKPAKNKQQQPVRRKRSFAWSRKKTLILIIVILAIIAVPIIFGEVLRAQYLASAKSAKESVKTLATNDILPMQKKDEYTAAQLRTTTEKLEKIRDDMCPGALLDNIALLYPRAKEAHAACIAQRTKIASVATAQRDMLNMLVYIEGTNAILTRVGTPTGEAFAVVATEQSNWQSATDELKKLNAPTPLKTAHEQLVAAALSITDGWSKLNTAGNDQNAANFQAAEEQLTKGYEAVRATKAVYIESVNGEQASLTTASKNLY